MLERDLVLHAFAVHERTVEAAEISQHESVTPIDDLAVILADDLVQELDGVVGMTPERIVGRQIDGLLTVRGHQHEPRHLRQASGAQGLGQAGPEFGNVPLASNGTLIGHRSGNDWFDRVGPGDRRTHAWPGERGISSTFSVAGPGRA